MLALEHAAADVVVISVSAVVWSSAYLRIPPTQRTCPVLAAGVDFM